MIQRNENSMYKRKTTELHQHKCSLTRKGNREDINEYQKALCHPSDAITCATALADDVLMKGEFNPYRDCSHGNQDKLRLPIKQSLDQ